MSQDLARPYSESRLEWLREEIAIARSRLEALAVAPPNDPWTETNQRRAGLDLAAAEEQLGTALGGGTLRLRLTGEAVHGDTIAAGALTSVIAPLQGLADDFGGELYLGQTQAGSYVVTLLPHPQLQLLDGSPLENVGDVIAAVIDATTVAEPDESVEDLASELSLEAVRSLEAFTRGLVENHLSAAITWSGPTGSKKERALTHQTSNRLLLALRNSSIERDQIEVEGDLLLGDISRRPRFVIRTDDGTELRGSVPPAIARSQVTGLALGGRVRARLEVVRRQRSATPTVAYRLLKVDPVGHGN
jgi:hypothetical protein